jgi:Tfp pilus assembly protein PilN
MRPVNLIPAELRRGDHAPLRTGPLPYIVLGALALAVIGVTLLVLAGNDVSERKAEVAQLHREDAIAQARAERLAPYTQFAAMTEQRVNTVRELADSRFDWERVMRELALILPHDVWLTSLDANATSGSSEGAAGGITGPSLELSGCAAGQEAVAGFVTALKDIEGVTRVGLESSAVSGGGGGEGGGGEGGAGCESRDFIAQFQMIVAFDAAPLPIVGGSAEEVAPEPESTEAAPEAGGEASTETVATGEGAEGG